MSERVLVEGDDFDDLEDSLKALGKRADKLSNKYPDDFGSTLDGDEWKENLIDYAKDLDDADAEDKCQEMIDDLADVVNALKHDKSPSYKEADELLKLYSKLVRDVREGFYEPEDDDLDDEAEGDDGHVYTTPDAIRFVNDMQNLGLDVKHYKGRFFWEGPSVQTSRKHDVDLQDIIKATRVKLQWDSMGLDQVVYPVKKDAGRKKGQKHESMQTFALGNSPAGNQMRMLAESAAQIMEADSKDLKDKYEGDDKPKYCYLYWPVKMDGVTDELHITAKFMGTLNLDPEKVFAPIREHLKEINLNELEWKPVTFDTKNDGDVKVLEFQKFPEHMKAVHDALEHLRKDDYPNYRAHVTVPAEIWDKVKKGGLTPADMGMEIGPIELKVNGEVHTA